MRSFAAWRLRETNNSARAPPLPARLYLPVRRVLVRELTRHVDLPAIALAHEQQYDPPAGERVAHAKQGRLVAAARLELGARERATGVRDPARRVERRRRRVGAARPGREDLVLQAALVHDDTLALRVGGEPGLSLLVGRCGISGQQRQSNEAEDA